MENKSETEEMPQVQGAFVLMTGWHTLPIREKCHIVAGYAPMGWWGVVVGQSHIVGCRHGGLSDGKQDVMQPYVVPLGTVIVGLAETVIGVELIG